jgi:hypothetical protein
MILHAPKSQQTVDFTIPAHVKKIGIHVSGGADSAILLYIVCRYIKDNDLDITVLPITSCIIQKPIMMEGTFRVTNKVRELFNYDIPFLLDNFLYYRGRKIFKFTNEVHKNMLSEGVVDMIIGAGTGWTSEEELKKNKMWEKRPLWRDKELNLTQYEPILEEDGTPTEYTLYKPFIRVDKKFTVEMYDLYGVRDTLFPVTRSCIDKFSKTEGWSKPCKKCWWCRERYWAFGEYDQERRTYLETIKDEVYSWDPERDTTDNDGPKALEMKLLLKNKDNLSNG